MKTMSEELRLGRLRRRLSQVDVAAMLGFSNATLSRIERGEKQPTVEEAHAVAKALSKFPDLAGDGTESQTILKLAENRQRLRIEIGLEEIIAKLDINQRDVLGTEPGKRSLTVVFYVELDKFGSNEIQESEETNTELLEYPRDR